jgi:hypothetical protein
VIKLRTKLWFVNAGASGTAAVLLAVSGSPLGFLFAGLAALYWHLGDVCVGLDLQERQGE